MTTGFPEGLRTWVETTFSVVVGGLVVDDSEPWRLTVAEISMVIIPSPETQPFRLIIRPEVSSRVTPVDLSSPVSESIS